MSQWLWLLRRLRDGAATREELFTKLEALLEGGHSADALVMASHEENDRSPLPPGTLEAIEQRMKVVTESTEGDKTQIIDRSRDATEFLVEGTGPVESWRTTVEVNAVLLGRFKLVQLIGEGGMSNVYKAIDLRKVEAGARDPHLAVKVLTVRFDDYFSSLSVMHHETSKLQTLTHPNIVRVIDFDRDGQTVFMTMEYLDGKSLKLRMPKHRADTQLPREQALRIVTSIALGARLRAPQTHRSRRSEARQRHRDRDRRGQGHRLRHRALPASAAGGRRTDGRLGSATSAR